MTREIMDTEFEIDNEASDYDEYLRESQLDMILGMIKSSLK